MNLLPVGGAPLQAVLLPAVSRIGRVAGAITVATPTVPTGRASLHVCDR